MGGNQFIPREKQSLQGPDLRMAWATIVDGQVVALEGSWSSRLFSRRDLVAFQSSPWKAKAEICL